MEITYLRAMITVQAKEDLLQPEFGKAIGQLINTVFSDKGKWTAFHKNRKRKGYTFSSLMNEKIANGIFEIKNGEVASFYLFSHNIELINLLENNLFENNFFKVLDFVTDTMTWKGPVTAIQVKNPILLKDDSNGERKIYVLRSTDSEKEKHRYLDYLNHSIISDFEYITGESLPSNFRYILDVKNPKISHYSENNRKLIGTKATFTIDTSLLGKLITQHLIAYGIGNKSSYLGAGSIILKGE